MWGQYSKERNLRYMKGIQIDRENVFFSRKENPSFFLAEKEAIEEMYLFHLRSFLKENFTRLKDANNDCPYGWNIDLNIF